MNFELIAEIIAFLAVMIALYFGLDEAIEKISDLPEEDDVNDKDE